jgi:dihydroorotate dehydrogenase electron transfer subunit
LNDKLQLFKGTIVSKEEILPGHFLISVSLTISFPQPKPGQFVMVKPEMRSDLLLPRPLSIYGFKSSHDDRQIKLFYRVVGKGTEQMSLLSRGSVIDVLGPLGSCFIVPEQTKKVMLVAGGMGIAPITYLASVINNDEFGKTGHRMKEVIGYMGAQSADRLIGIEDLQKNCSKVIVSTDDGSYGCSGVVTDMLLNDLLGCSSEETAVYACGPEPMLKCLAEMFVNNRMFCQVSVERRMACGIGACLGCAVKMKSEKAETIYKRTCKEGPVFNINDLVFDA